MKAKDTYVMPRNSIQLQLQQTRTFLPTNSSHSFALQSRLNKLLKTRRHTEFSMRKDLSTPSALFVCSHPRHKPLLHQQKIAKAELEQTHLS
jgi:hypothetical protein